MKNALKISIIILFLMCTWGVFSNAYASKEEPNIQITFTMIFGALTTLFSILIGGYVALLRYAFNQEKIRIDMMIKQAEEKIMITEKKLEKVDSDIDSLDEKDSSLKQELIKLQTEVSNTSRIVEDIKKDQVTRKEWELQMTAVHKQLNQISDKLGRFSGQYNLKNIGEK